MIFQVWSSVTHGPSEATDYVLMSINILFFDKILLFFYSGMKSS